MNVVLPDAQATAALGAALAQALSARPGLVVHLTGELGAGKTTLARGLLRALGVTGAIRSPTYTLIEPYEAGARSVLHVDLYRIRGEDELENLGLGDYPPDRTWWLVEWPQRAPARLPAADVTIDLGHHAAGREARLGTPGLSAAERAWVESAVGSATLTKVLLEER